MAFLEAEKQLESERRAEILIDMSQASHGTKESLRDHFDSLIKK